MYRHTPEAGFFGQAAGKAFWQSGSNFEKVQLNDSGIVVAESEAFESARRHRSRLLQPAEFSEGRDGSLGRGDSVRDISEPRLSVSATVQAEGCGGHFWRGLQG